LRHKPVAATTATILQVFSDLLQVWPGSPKVKFLSTNQQQQSTDLFNVDAEKTQMCKTVP